MQLSTVADRRIHTPLRQQSTSLAVRSDRRRLREVSVAEREQPDSLSMLLTTRWMNQYIWEPRFYPPVFFFFFINPHYHCTWTCPKMLILVGHLPRAHVKFSIFPRTPDLQAKHLGSPVSQSEPRIYMCCLSGSAGSSWHIHLSPLCVLEQNLIPESTLTWLFLGQQLHYGAPAW